MSTVLRAAVLGLLLTGAAVSAFAQSENLASLPPDSATTPTQQATAPLAQLPADPAANTGDPRDLWNNPEVQAQTGPAPYNSR
jgi:hypothetical protein